MVAGRLSRYFGRRFLSASLIVFVGVFGLVLLVDYLELMRRSAGEPNASAMLAAGISVTRVPQIMERIMPFAVLVGAMMCYLNLSRRLELVVARSAGMSAWQFVAPAVLAALAVGAVATAVYNPVAAMLQEQSKRLEDRAFNNAQQSGLQSTGTGFWVRQKSVEGQSIINAVSSADQGVRLGGVTVFVYDPAGRFVERTEAKTAILQEGHWQLVDVRRYPIDAPPEQLDTFAVKTNLTLAQVRETFATPETVSFWDLPFFIEMADHAGLAAAGYRLQYQKLLSRPALLAAMVLVAAAFSLRFFRFGGVQKMVLSGIVAGFLLYVLSKVTEDLSKAELMHPAAAAWLPVILGVLTGLVPLLYLEDG
ncbi:MAG: LPS export ABC transporter permease LptG [Rhodoplanes sp.]|uniref:LPS export ABC transporter permease LptG n=1 Tax=Rhodoplanes sp. TaxID=1968906 RepID=UPI001807B85D|nr:LPS export ABC transporter permease LptG [Rhodoplanes sp.]NVO17689.1 LPS export ABC transporter permease LptG [Rhodoplanes sp.]